MRLESIRYILPLILVFTLLEGCSTFFVSKKVVATRSTTQELELERSVGNALRGYLWKLPAEAASTLQSICLKVIGDTCVFINKSEQIIMYVPGSGMFISRSALESTHLEVELRALLTFEQERRKANVSLNLSEEHQKTILRGDLYCQLDQRDIDQQVESILEKTWGRMERNQFDGRAMASVFERLKSHARCKSISMFRSDFGPKTTFKIRETRLKLNASIPVNSEQYRKVYRLLYPPKDESNL